MTEDTAETTADQVRCDLFVTADVIITVDESRRVLHDGAIAVTDERIVAVGAAAELEPYRRRADRVLDAGASVALPGFTDGHTHLFQTLGRDLGDGMSLVPWLRSFMFPYAKTITRSQAVAAVQLGALQAALAGTTFVVDNHYAPTDTETTLAVAAAIEEVGIRGAVARGIFGEPNPGGDLMGVAPELFTYSEQEELAITRECLAERPHGSQVEIWPGPENIVYVTPELITASAELAEEADVRWHMHCSEAQDEIGFFETVHSTRPVEWLSREGILTERTTLAHAIWLDDAEVAAMGETGATAAHNPISNQYLASGVLRFNDLIDAGANVALGSDGIAIGGQDIVEAMKAGALMHRVANLNPTETTVEQLVEAATRGGATMTGLDGGAIEVGKVADIVIMDVDKVGHTPWNRPVSSVVHSGRAADVTTVIVAGDVIVENGHSTKVDESAVRDAAERAARELFGEAGLNDLTMDWQSTENT